MFVPAPWQQLATLDIFLGLRRPSHRNCKAWQQMKHYRDRDPVEGTTNNTMVDGERYGVEVGEGGSIMKHPLLNCWHHILCADCLYWKKMEFGGTSIMYTQTYQFARCARGGSIYGYATWLIEPRKSHMYGMIQSFYYSLFCGLAFSHHLFFFKVSNQHESGCDEKLSYSEKKWDLLTLLPPLDVNQVLTQVQSLQSWSLW